MKNLSLILNIILFALVGHLYYLNSKCTKPADNQAIIQPVSQAGGAHIAYVNADTLDAQYEWLKTQKAAIEQRLANAEKTLSSKEEALMKEAAALQEKFQQGNMTQAEAEKQQSILMQRGQKLEEEKKTYSLILCKFLLKSFDILFIRIR